MVHIVLYVVQWTYFGEDAFGYLFVVAQDFFQRIGMELHARLQVQVFAEGEAAQVVALHDVAQLHILLFQTHHGRAGEHDFQVGGAVVAHTQFLAPFRVLEFGGELHDAMSGEVEVVHVDEEAGAVCAEFLFGILQQESSLTYASCAFDTDKTVIPVYFVH